MLNSSRPVTSSLGRVRRNRAAWWGGMFSSVVLHTLAVLLWAGDRVHLEEDAPGQRMYPHTAGGGLIQSIRVSFPQREEIPLPPDPIIDLKMPLVDMSEISISLPAVRLFPVELPSRLPGVGDGSGSGPGGFGFGDVGDDETEYGYQAPFPKFVAPQWDPPESVRGLEVTVYVLVDEDGWPRDVELDPPTPDDGFNGRIVNQVKGWKYQPARRHGRSTVGWAEITFVF